MTATDAAGSTPVITSPASAWDYDMDRAPRGRKMLLLTSRGICVVGALSGEARGYIAWAGLPARDEAREREMGIRVG